MKRVLLFFGLLLIVALLLIRCNLIWTSPKSYLPEKQFQIKQTIMSLEEYTKSGLINNHPRPYSFQIENKLSKGAVCVVGLDHTKDPQNQQLVEIENQWVTFRPTVALVEGRLGFLFSWAQDPVRTLGEGGMTAKLAKSNGVKLYSWEPEREAEIEYLLTRFDPIHIAAFYCLRPYRGNYSELSKDEANRVMKNLIAERTNRRGIQGSLTSVEQLDSLWKADFPQLEDWRTYKHPRNGWPTGILEEIADATNSVRDEHMCNSILDLVRKGERVFITMGASHAPRIEKALNVNLTNSERKFTEKQLSDTLAIIKERELIPEGTAYDPRRDHVFVSSMYKRKIVAIEQDGSYYDYIGTGEDDLWSVLGMEVDPIRDKLWAISTKGAAIPTYPPILNDRWQSRLHCYDLNKESLERVYEVSAKMTDKFAFNDLTVSKSGDVYITESITNKIYILRNGSMLIEEFLKPEGFTFLNGIALSPDNTSLFVSSTEGILKIHLASKKYKTLPYEFTTVPRPIDGLTFFKNSLIGHQSIVITRFFLNKSLDSILRHQIVDDQFLNSSTTGEKGKNGWYYYIANSQIRSGIDYKNKRIRPIDSLQEVVIKRKKL